MDKIEQYISLLDMQPHVEGGFYKETYRGKEFEFEGFEGSRSVSTGIYFLLRKQDFSAFHKIKSDEMWHHYDGGSLAIYVIDQAGELDVIKLGLNVQEGEKPQAVVPAGCWFASRVDSGDFVLSGCTVAPGFDFVDFELANRDELVEAFPEHRSIIQELTR